MKKIKKMLSNFYVGLKKQIFKPGRGVLKVLLIIVAVLIALAMGAGLILGCVVAVLSIPALILMFAFNWVVPAFGGPALTFKMAMGLMILIALVTGFLRK